jgi:hypothetical protein
LRCLLHGIARSAEVDPCLNMQMRMVTYLKVEADIPWFRIGDFLSHWRQKPSFSASELRN